MSHTLFFCRICPAPCLSNIRSAKPKLSFIARKNTNKNKSPLQLKTKLLASFPSAVFFTYHSSCCFPRSGSLIKTTCLPFRFVILILSKAATSLPNVFQSGRCFSFLILSDHICIRKFCCLCVLCSPQHSSA